MSFHMQFAAYRPASAIFVHHMPRILQLHEKGENSEKNENIGNRSDSINPFQIACIA